MYRNKSVSQQLAGSYFSHLTPRVQTKLVNVVGEKCTVRCRLDDVDTECLYDTGAHVSLMSEGWLQSHFPKRKLRNVTELLEEDVVLFSATDTKIPSKGYINVAIQLPLWDNWL